MRVNFRSYKLIWILVICLIWVFAIRFVVIPSVGKIRSYNSQYSSKVEAFNSKVTAMQENSHIDDELMEEESKLLDQSFFYTNLEDDLIDGMFQDTFAACDVYVSNCTIQPASVVEILSYRPEQSTMDYPFKSMIKNTTGNSINRGEDSFSAYDEDENSVDLDNGVNDGDLNNDDNNTDLSDEVNGVNIDDENAPLAEGTSRDGSDSTQGNEVSTNALPCIVITYEINGSLNGFLTAIHSINESGKSIEITDINVDVINDTVSGSVVINCYYVDMPN